MVHIETAYDGQLIAIDLSKLHPALEYIEIVRLGYEWRATVTVGERTFHMWQHSAIDALVELLHYVGRMGNLKEGGK